MSVHALPLVEVNARSEAHRRVDLGVERLTSREMQIVEAYTRHGLHKSVAHELGISEQATKNHTARIFDKLDVNSMAQACVMVDRYLRDSHTWPEVDRRHGERRSGSDRRQP